MKPKDKSNKIGTRSVCGKLQNLDKRNESTEETERFHVHG